MHLIVSLITKIYVQFVGINGGLSLKDGADASGRKAKVKILQPIVSFLFLIARHMRGTTNWSNY